MDVNRSVALVPSNQEGMSIAPGQIWRLSKEFRSYLRYYLQEVRATSIQISHWQSHDLPEFVMIVREPETDSEDVTVLPLSPHTEYVNDRDLIVPTRVSGLDRAVLAETWHTFTLPVSHLLETTGNRFNQATYTLIMDVGDIYHGLAPAPDIKQLHQRIEACGLEVVAVSTEQQRRIERFRHQEELWSELFSLPIEQHTDYVRSMNWVSEALQSTIVQKSVPLPTLVQSAWSDTPSLPEVFGRKTELRDLEHWMVQDQCKIVTILGKGGIGKSVLAANFAKQIEPQFNRVVWQSLRHAPTLEKTVADIIEKLSEGQERDRRPWQTNEKITDDLIEYLKAYSCLVILDNFDALPMDDPTAKEYYKSYCELLQQIQNTPHQSCVILTSRTEPPDLVTAPPQLARSLSLKGLKPTAGMQILKAEGVKGTETKFTEISKLYRGNPLALKIAAGMIKETWHNDVDQFLAEIKQREELGGIEATLDRQFCQLPDLAQTVMYWLAVNRKPISVKQLCADIADFTLEQEILNALDFLERQSLIEKETEQFTLQPLVMEWVTQRLIDCMIEEFQDTTKLPKLFNRHALVKAQSKDYIQTNQRQLILQPLFDQLLEIYPLEQLKNRCFQLMSAVRETAPLQCGYLAANAIALLRQAKVNLSHGDLSHLAIWQADFQGIDLNGTNLSHSDLSHSVFTKTLSSVLTIAFHPDGRRLASGDKSGNLRVWQVPDGELLVNEKHPGGWLRSVCFSPDGKRFASAGDGQTIKLWCAETGKCLQTLRGHTNKVRSIAFSPDNCRLVSAGDDKTIRIWNLNTSETLMTLQRHLYLVRSVAFSPDGSQIASASADQTIRIWNSTTGDCVHTFFGHKGTVFAIAFSPDGQKVVSVGGDRTVRLWDIQQGTYQIIGKHNKQVRAVIFSGDGNRIISGSEDATVKVWDVVTHQCLKTLTGHTSWVRALALNDEGMLASGSSDHRIKLWNLQEGQSIRTFQGYARRVWSIAADPEGRLVASAGEDAKIRLWEVTTGKCIKSLEGHTDWVRSVHFSPDGALLASGAHDQTVRLWQVETGNCVRKLEGHQHRVRAVCFSPDGTQLATGGHDQTIRLWNVQTGQCFRIFKGHRGCVRSLSFSPDGRILISGSPDRTIRVWEVASGNCLQTIPAQGRISAVRFAPSGDQFATAGEDHLVRLWDVQAGSCIRSLPGHSDWVQSIAFDATGDYLVSGSEDQTVRVWDLTTGACVATLEGHEDWIRSVAVSPDGTLVMSGAEDQTLRIWDWQAGVLKEICRNPKPYEQMNITGVTGLPEHERSALERLGAIDVDGGS